jgi:hypothetical protein
MIVQAGCTYSLPLGFLKIHKACGGSVEKLWYSYALLMRQLLRQVCQTGKLNTGLQTYHSNSFATLTVICLQLSQK